MTNLSTHFPHNRQQILIGGNSNRAKQHNIQIRGVTIKSKKKPVPQPAARKSQTVAPAASTQERGRISARELHKYVIGLVGIFMLFTFGYSIALYRVERATKLARTTTDRQYSPIASN